jgi:putative peptidoglycan lipid II flippase
MDALVIGLSVADLLVALLAGSFLVVFIPLYAEWREREGTRVADVRGLNLIAVILLGLTLAGVGLMLGGGTVAGWVGYGFRPEQRQAAATLMPWLAVYVWATGAAVLATGFYHVRGRFLMPQVAQIAERIVVLAAIIVLVPLLAVYGVAMAMALGGVALLATLTVGTARRRPLVWPRVAPRSPEVRAYVVLFLPLLGAAVIDQAVLFTDRAMASTLEPGGVSALYYASVLWRMPVVLLCDNFVTVLFPRLSADVAHGDPATLRRSLSFGLKTMVLLMLGATALVLVLSRDLTALFFERGEFGRASTELTALTLATLALCLVFKAAGNVVNVALYASQRTGIVAGCGLSRVILNVVFNALLIGPLGAVGIALSTSLTLALWFGIVWVPFRREMRRRGVDSLVDPAFRSLLAKSAVAALAAGGMAAWLAGTGPLAGEGFGMRLVRLAVAGSAGVATYGIVLHLLRLPEAVEAARALAGRLSLRGSQ